MKKHLKIIISAVLAAVIVSALAFAAVTAARRASENRYIASIPEAKTGETQYVTFGKYPQSEVEDEELLSRLNALPLTFTSYGYYNGDGSMGSAVQSDYMTYADVAFEGETYRAVRFSEHRSYCCHGDPAYNWQATVFEYQYQPDQVYWYRFDPIRWIVLDANEGLLVAENVLDAQPINSVIYSKTPKADLYSREFYKDAACKTVAADYYTSDIRQWLNTTFLETAFSEEETAQIAYSELDNAYQTQRNKKLDSQDSTDRVFLLSYDEITNPTYGFSARAEKPDKNRVSYPSTYALIQGLWTNESGVSYWWLRTAKSKTALNGATLDLAVNYEGTICFSYLTPYSPDCIDTGIRPAIRLAGQSDIEKRISP